MKVAAMNKVKDLSMPNMLFTIMNTVFMLVICVITLFPVLNVLAVSLSADVYVYSGSVTFFPRGLQFDSYKKVLSAASIWRSFLNSIIVAGFSCIFSLIFTSLASYPLAFCEFHGKKIYTFMILLTMWFSGGIIPSFMVMQKLHLVNTLWALIIGPLIVAYHVIILRTFYKSIPVSLVESAYIDGANEFSILLKIIAPLSKAALATIALWIIVARWNDFMGPIIYLRDNHKYTLQVVLRDIVLTASYGAYGVSGTGSAEMESLLPEQIRNATIMFALAPMLLIYPFLQKYFVKGVMLGSIKE